MRGLGAARLVSRVVMAVSWAAALALLAKGHAGAGDGFSAGLTAATGTLVHVLSAGAEEAGALAVVRRGGVIARVGLLFVLIPALAPLIFGEPPFTPLPAPDSEAPELGVLRLGSALVLEVGVFAVVLGLVLRAMALLGDFEQDGGRA